METTVKVYFLKFPIAVNTPFKKQTYVVEILEFTSKIELLKLHKTRSLSCSRTRHKDTQTQENFVWFLKVVDVQGLQY